MRPDKMEGLQKLDLTKVTRPGVLTIISLANNDYDFEEWIRCGEIQITYRDNADKWDVGARLNKVTDREHDSAYAFAFEVVGLKLPTTLGYGVSEFVGWMKGTGVEDFRVPVPELDPLEGAEKCDSCTGADSHKIIDRFMPQPNPALFKRVRGVRVKISMGAKAGR